MNPKQSIKPSPIDPSIRERWLRRKRIIRAKVSLPRFFDSSKSRTSHEVWEYATEIDPLEIESYTGLRIQGSPEV